MAGNNPIVLTEELLTRIAQAATRNPQTVSRVVIRIADELGTSVEDVIKAVRDAAGVVGGALLALAKAAGAAIESAISAGALTASGAAAGGAVGAAGASASSGGGIAGWFTGLNVAAQAAAVVGAVVLTSAVAQSVSGGLSMGAAEGFKAIGVQVDGVTRIVSVRHTDALADGIAPCRFRHGGTDCDGVAEIVELDPIAYETALEATEALCGLLDGPRVAPGLSDGWNVPYDGSTVTLDDWGHVDLAACDAVIESAAGG